MIKLSRITFLFTLTMVVIGSTFAQSTWTGANNSSWNDAGNWSPSGIPGAGDNVIINSGTVNISTSPNAEINSLTMNGGTLDLSGSLTLTINGNSNIGSGATLDLSGALTLNANMVVEGQLIMSDGGIFGPGDLTIDGDFNWNGSAVEITGQFINTGIIDITSAQLRTTLDNQGTVNQTGDFIISTGGKYNNNAMHDFQNNSDLNENVIGTQGITNNGTMVKTGGTSRSDILVSYDGSGSVEAQTGSVEFRASSTQSGTLISSGGSIKFPTTSHSFDGVSIQGSGFTEVNGATISMDSDVSATNLLFSGGEISGVANLTVSNAMSWMGGQFGNSVDAGQVFISNVFTIDGPNGKFLATTLTNNGTATWIDGAWLFQDDAIFINENSFDVQTSDDMSGSSHQITNNGTWSRTLGASTNMLGPIFTNTGTLSVETGTVQLFNGSNTGTITVSSGAAIDFAGSSSLFTNAVGGAIGGSGDITIGGNLVNNGSLAPGASPGILTIGGGSKLTLGSTSTIDIEIGGTTVGTEYDQINFTGSTALDGDLNVTYINGFVPENLNSFTLFTSASSSGQFQNINVEPIEGLITNINDAGTIVSVTYLEASNYFVETLPFVRETLENPVVVNLEPGELETNVPIGFDFNFFGNVKTSLSISQNASVTFGTEDIGEAVIIPNTNTPNGFIAGFQASYTQQPFGEITYSLNGTAPNRTFIVDYDKLKHDTGEEVVSLQIKLFEGSNKVEIHCEDCPSGGNNIVQGIENDLGSKAFTFPGRNRTDFSLTDDAVAFVPITATAISQTEIVLNFPELTVGGALSRAAEGGGFVAVTTIPLGTTSFTDTGLDPFTVYNYQLTGGFGDDEPVSSFNYIQIKTLPDPFTDLIAQSKTSNSVSLNWTDNTLGMDGFRLDRATSPDGPFETFVPEELERPLTDGDLQPATTYYYRLGATTAFGHAIFSNVLEVTTDAPDRLFVDENATGTNDGTSWQNAFTDLADALNGDGKTGDEIWVAAGTYKPANAGSSFNLENGVLVYGSFAGNETTLEEREIETNPTILSGDIGIVGDPADNVNTILMVVGETDHHLIDGLTIRDGFGGSAGAGIYIDESNLTIQHCTITENTTSSRGAGIYLPGRGNLTIIDSEISNNTATDGGGGIFVEQPDGIYQTKLDNVFISNNTASQGAGIYYEGLYGTLDIVNAELDGNSLTSGSNDGGGILLLDGKLILENSKVNNNSATNNGGGIYVQNVTEVKIENTQIDGNEAGFGETNGKGGGLYIDNAAFDGATVVIVNSTISSNISPDNGAGFFSASGSHNIINSTFSGNTSASGNGAGIAFESAELDATLNHVTVTSNAAPAGDGGGIFTTGGSLAITNVLLAGNTDDGSSPDVSGTLTSGGYNIIGDLGATIFDSNTTGDKYGDTQGTTTLNAGAEESATAIDPLLDVLADNFGITQTHALLAGSPAIDMGTTVDFEGQTLTTDQRGFPLMDSPDIGSYEFNDNYAPVLDNSMDLTLTAIDEDNVNSAGDLVSDLINGLITDQDGTTFGIAVVAANNTNGAWEYSLNSGGTWTDFGSPSSTAARLLASDGNTQIRFIPGADFNGTVTGGLTFHAWDQSEGSNGGTLDASATGGNTAFSLNSETIDIVVNAINDEPVLEAIGDQTTQEEVALSFTAVGTDVDTGSTLTYSLDATSIGDGMTLDASTGVFNWTPSSSQSGTYSVEIAVSDGSLMNSEVFSINVDNVLGASDSIQPEITVYPNPVVHSLNLSLANDYRGELAIRIFSLLGKEVQVFSKQKTATSFETDLDVSDLMPGTYFIEIRQEGRTTLFQRLIKNN